MWKELIRTLTDTCEFQQPVSPKELAAAENQLQINGLPHELKDLLTESDGVTADYGIDIVWPLNRIVQDNIGFRSYADFKELYMPFDHLLFFADAGNGDQFAFSILNGSILRDDVYVWNHEDDSRTWIAASLRQFIEGWLRGTISV